MGDLREKRKVLLGITGSVAAYKAAELARIFIQRGYSVRVAMTRGATEFVTPMLLESITGEPVFCDVYEEDGTQGIGHIQLADWADTFVIAPATANVIAKLAHGIADCPITTIALATKANLLICPAMNVNMFTHVATQENIEKLRSRGVHFVDPEEGALACGWEGTGRLASPWEIFENTRRELSELDFAGKRILVTTGATRESIDPVRFLSNRSSGKMGVAIAREAFRRGAEVTLVHGVMKPNVPSAIKTIGVVSAAEMRDAVLKQAFEVDNLPDVVIMAAAVSDFKPATSSETKLKKGNVDPNIPLIENPDILAELGQRKTEQGPMLVGFAVETGELEDLIGYVREKLAKKNADIIIGNFAEEALELDTNRVWIISKSGRQDEVATTYKSRVANRILDAVLKAK